MGTESRLTERRIMDLWVQHAPQQSSYFDPFAFARDVESAVRSQYEADLRQAREALQSCGTGGYVDIDGDYRRTMRFDRDAVSAALSALNARLGDSNQEKSDASK